MPPRPNQTQAPAAAAPATTLGTRIRALRQERALTSTQLGRAAGISQPFVTEIERGRKSPSMGTLSRIAAALGVPVGELMDPVPSRPRRIPVIQPAACFAWQAQPAAPPPVSERGTAVMAEIADPDAFFVEADGGDMIGGPVQRGALLLVSPNASLAPGCLVLAAHPDGVTVGRLQRRNTRQVVQALKPGPPRPDTLLHAPVHMHRIVRIQIDC